MPYRARGKQVQVKKNGEWQPFRVAESEAKAKAQAAALNIKLHENHQRKGK